MNEAETRAEHIDPALAAAGWGMVEGSRIRRGYLIAHRGIEPDSYKTVSEETAYQCKLSALDDLKKPLPHQAFSGQLTTCSVEKGMA